MKILLKGATVSGFDKAGKYSVTNLQVKHSKKSVLTMSFLSNALTGDVDNLSIWVKDSATKIPCKMDDLDTQKLSVSELIQAGIVTLEAEKEVTKTKEVKSWSL